MDHDRVGLMYIGELAQEFGEPLVGCHHEQVVFDFSSCNNPYVATAVLLG